MIRKPHDQKPSAKPLPALYDMLADHSWLPNFVACTAPDLAPQGTQRNKILAITPVVQDGWICSQCQLAQRRTCSQYLKGNLWQELHRMRYGALGHRWYVLLSVIMRFTLSVPWLTVLICGAGIDKLSLYGLCLHACNPYGLGPQLSCLRSHRH